MLKPVVLGDREKTIELCADYFINLYLNKKKDFFVALPGGKTPLPIFEKIVERPIDFSKIHLFWGDERVVPPNSSENNYFMAMKSFSKTNIPEKQIHRMVTTGDLEKNALDYEEIILKEVPNSRFDLIMLGLGEDGHIASLFPNNLNFGFLPSESTKIYDEIDPLSTKRIAEDTILERKEDQDRVKIVDSEQIKSEVQVNSPLLKEQTKLVAINPEPKRMTLTYKCINNASNVIIIAIGKQKANIVKKVLNTTNIYPVHGIKNAILFLDQEAAALC